VRNARSERRLRVPIANPSVEVLRRPLESAQYACKDYRAILARHGITRSMSRKGNCYDNAPMESFFGSLKSELVHRTSFPTREAARRAIFEYVEAFYNRRRRHSGLGFLTPAQAYEQMAGAA
jgi:putative transposase